MKKLKLIIWYICVIVCTIVVDFLLHYQGKENETDLQVLKQKVIDYNLRRSLYIMNDSIEYNSDMEILDNMQIDENRLVIALSYFNHKNIYNIFLTKDEALQEYENFCTGSGTYDNILLFSMYSWEIDRIVQYDLENEFEYLGWDSIEEADSGQLAEICDNIMEYSDIWREAESVDYGEYSLEKRLLDTVSEEKCSIDENGNYYIELNGGIAKAYCEWGKYAPPYSKEKLYITKIVYDGGDNFKENEDEQAHVVFRGYPAFGCYVGKQYDVENMKNNDVTGDWVFIDENTQNPCFRYDCFQVLIELNENRVNKVTLSIVEG